MMLFANSWLGRLCYCAENQSLDEAVKAMRDHLSNICPLYLVRLRLGDVVPADVKLSKGDPIEVDQSALTSESLPVEKSPASRFTPAPF
jgi:H+-transporting ATPase